jgi:hypothetical protein
MLSTMAVLALAAWVHPAFSATGTDARCDQSPDAPEMSISDDGKLALRIIGHGTPTAAAADDLGLEAADADTASYPAGPRVDVMLRRIFDEARARQPSISEPQETGDLSAPLAVDKTEKVDDAVAVLEFDPADSTAEFPGFSPDELSRYRQQMYRTDI